MNKIGKANEKTLVMATFLVVALITGATLATDDVQAEKTKTKVKNKVNNNNEESSSGGIISSENNGESHSGSGVIGAEGLPLSVIGQSEKGGDGPGLAASDGDDG